MEIIQPCGCKKGLHLLYVIDNIYEILVYVYKALHCIADHGKDNQLAGKKERNQLIRRTTIIPHVNVIVGYQCGHAFRSVVF